MKNEKVITLKRNFCKVYKTQDSFHDEAQKKDILFDVFYVLIDDEKVKFNNQQLRDSVLWPFVANLVDFFEETFLESGEIRNYFKMYIEKVPKKDKDGKIIFDKNGVSEKNTLFYVLLNNKKGYLPGWVLKFKSADGSKIRDLELPLKAAPRFTEEYTSTVSDESTTVDGNIPF